MATIQGRDPAANIAKGCYIASASNGSASLIFLLLYFTGDNDSRDWWLLASGALFVGSIGFLVLLRRIRKKLGWEKPSPDEEVFDGPGL